MTTTFKPGVRRDQLPEGTLTVHPRGILARVRRICGEHEAVCVCVGQRPDQGCLVFWCPAGRHHVTFGAGRGAASPPLSP